VAQNPTPENISQLSIAFPEMSEQFKRSYDMLQPAQQRAKLQFGTQVYAAMQSDRPDIAAQLLNDRATALENSGGNPQEIAARQAMAELGDHAPGDCFKLSSGVMLARHHGPGQVRRGVQGHHRGADRRKKSGRQGGGGRRQGQRGDHHGAERTGEAGPPTSRRCTRRRQPGRPPAARSRQADVETQTKLRELNLQYGTPAPETSSADQHGGRQCGRRASNRPAAWWISRIAWKRPTARPAAAATRRRPGRRPRAAATASPR
jgi:hypothetical protein